MGDPEVVVKEYMGTIEAGLLTWQVMAHSLSVRNRSDYAVLEKQQNSTLALCLVPAVLCPYPPAWSE